MSAERNVLRVISAKRPRAKFVEYSHSSSFIDSLAQLGEGFHYINLYDEQIDSNLIVSNKNGLIMVHNTYLSSFAYNLFLCWLYGNEKIEDEGKTLDFLIAHNFKKFFAEQLYYAHNDIGSRGLLLETLLYEQSCMVPVFALKRKDETLSSRADAAANLMSSIVSTHELGHFFLDTMQGSWETFLASHPKLLGSLFERVQKTYPPVFIEEFKCDVMSIISGLQENTDIANLEFYLRVIVFAFAAFSVLFSLSRSAKVTGEARYKDSTESVNFLSLEKVHREHDIKLGIDNDFVERAKLVSELCQSIAQGYGIDLYNTNGAFPLPETIIDKFLQYIDRVLDCDDANVRSMSSLVAEALHGHDEGMEYLYLRSKTFTTNREEPLSV